MRMYDHLTLLNVLYFSGTLLIIGAYTLFMTLAWELARAGGLSAVMVAQVALSGASGSHSGSRRTTSSWEACKCSEPQLCSRELKTRCFNYHAVVFIKGYYTGDSDS